MKSRRFGLIAVQSESDFLKTSKDVLVYLLQKVNPVERVRISRVSKLFCDVISSERALQLERANIIKENRVAIKKLLLDSGIAERVEKNKKIINVWLSSCETKCLDNPINLDILKKIREFIAHLDQMLLVKLSPALDECAMFLDKRYSAFEDKEKAAILNPLIVEFETNYLQYLDLLKEKLANEKRALPVHANGTNNCLVFFKDNETPDQFLKRIFAQIIDFIDQVIVELKNYQWRRVSTYPALGR